ncbi:MAG: AAA family ATPase [Planctomycetaceae bacterium]|nr:AAA family ATPase [Planctomycetaceae bacterium]
MTPLDEIIGQPRAERAFEVSLGVRRPGYHIYLAGAGGTGKAEMARKTLEERARSEPPPSDWLDVNNFDETEQPIAISLPAGRGVQLRRDMLNLITRLMDELPKAFQREDFGREKERLRQQFKKQNEELTGPLNALATERGFAIQQVGESEFLFVPLKDGKPITHDAAQELSADEITRIERSQQELMEATEKILHKQQDIERELTADVQQVERAFAARVIEPMLTEIAERTSNEKVSRWLDRLKGYFLRNLDRFRRRAGKLQLQQIEELVGEPMQSDVQERFFEYQVNLLVDNSEFTHAPVVFEPVPNHRHLFGTIDRMVDRFGRVVTNFSRIKAGSLLRANGGYLVVEIEDLLTEPFVWKELKRALKSGATEIEVFDPFALFTVSSLKPEPIPLDVKLVVLGPPLLYHLLSLYDDDFREMFKVKADFDNQIPLDHRSGQIYGQLVRKLSQNEKVPPFDAPAVAELVRASARIAGDRRKLTAEFRRIVDVIHEAAYWASRDSATIVESKHVRRALEEQIFRSDLVAESIRNLIAEGTLLIDLGEPAIGRINGLAVADLGDYSFGWPSRVTASVGIGTAGLINIERESRLSGRTFDKGILILEGYLRNQYAREFPLALSASLAMEQSYGGIEGDSASLAELLCLLSAIANIPLRQDVAVTGSVNQCGQVQAIGAVNEKVEGFFDICQDAGLTGHQGVCLPAANTKHLVLRQDVLDAVRDGRFHLWPVATIDQAIGLLMGTDPGEIEREETVHGRVARRLREMTEKLKEVRGNVPLPTATTAFPIAIPSPDPRPPLPGRPKSQEK